MTLSRRSVLKAGVTAGLTALALPWARTASAQVRTRYSASSPQGKAMLARYAQAVALMMNPAKIPPGDPRSWNFQWFTHWVPGPQSPWSAVVAARRAMLDKVYAGKPPNDPQRKLAQAMWNDCQAHGNNPSDPNFFQEMYFCVWHRFYVYFFEQIVASVLNDPTFSLPYWDYLSGQVSDLSIPPEFRDASSPLFRPNRNPWVNAGQRIDTQNPGSLSLDALDETLYIDAPDGAVGFCPMLDANPHGLVHVYVGRSNNMGAIPYAAGDPLFWLHHCNIDRLWESWNRAPNRTNPTWPARTFPFADGQGKPVAAAPAKADRVALMKYDYDRYASPPSGGGMAPSPPSPPTTAVGAGQSVSRVTRAFSPEPIKLGAARLSVNLAPSEDASDAAPQSVFALSAPGRRLYLVLGGIAAPPDAASTYNVFLGLPDGVANPAPSDPHFVGTLHFFGASGHDEHASSSHKIVLNITRRAAALTKAGAFAGTPRLTLVRHGEPESAPPTVSQVYLMEG